jgi:hypothetical protein
MPNRFRSQWMSVVLIAVAISHPEELKTNILFVSMAHPSPFHHHY